MPGQVGGRHREGGPLRLSFSEHGDGAFHCQGTALEAVESFADAEVDRKGSIHGAVERLGHGLPLLERHEAVVSAAAGAVTLPLSMAVTPSRDSPRKTRSSPGQ